MKLNLSDKAKKVISLVAPTLGAALGGPLGGLAGQVLGGLVGGDDPKALEEALITQKPETMLALRKAEQDFVVQLEQLGIERERIAMADRASARDLAKVDMRPQMVISALFLFGYFTVMLVRMSGYFEVERGDQENLNTLFSVLTVGVPIILAFWFGSTAGSQAKSALLYKTPPID